MTQFLDNDLYNFTMSYFVWKYFPQVEVKYEFKNRSTNVNTSTLLEDIGKYIEYFSPDKSELNYLKSLNLFEDRFVDALSPDDTWDIQFDLDGGLSYSGLWWQALLFETPILSTIAEKFCKGELTTEMDLRIKHTIESLKTYPYLNFFEFGTRRRACLIYQKQVLEKILAERPYQLHGTSNVMLAKEYGIAPKGTLGHQLFMVLAALSDPISSTLAVQYKWNELYPQEGMHTFLTDTFGTDFFLENHNPNRAHGLRQDSGNPFVIGRKIFKFWEEQGVDTRQKLLVFSDGLDVRTMADLWGQFGTRTNVFFGWGTNLTGATTPVSIVIKPSQARANAKSPWRNCIKLSDNLAKATGDEAEIERYKEICGYTSNFYEKAVY